MGLDNGICVKKNALTQLINLNNTFIDSNYNSKNTSLSLTNPDVPEEHKARRGRPRKDEVQPVNDNDIVRAEGTVEEHPTIYSYSQMTSLLQETVQQVDMVAAEIKEELDSAIMSRTMRNKQNYIIGLASGIGKLLETKEDFYYLNLVFLV